jgi:hypothetical protein
MITNLHRIEGRSADHLYRVDIDPIVPQVLLGIAAICLLVIGLVAVFATGGVLA